MPKTSPHNCTRTDSDRLLSIANEILFGVIERRSLRVDCEERIFGHFCVTLHSLNGDRPGVHRASANTSGIPRDLANQPVKVSILADRTIDHGSRARGDALLFVQQVVRKKVL